MNYVLDSYPLLALFLDESPAAGEVDRVLERSEDGECRVGMSLMNTAEVFYIVAKRTSIERAGRIRRSVAGLPVEFLEPSEATIWGAADLKARHAISFADAFAARLALDRGAELVTGDPEFRALERTDDLRLHWLE